MLWRVLKKFTARERELFLRFVWGRSRLPVRSEDFEQKVRRRLRAAPLPARVSPSRPPCPQFQIMPTHRNDDYMLPIAHTCFFQLELPRYSCEQVMREKLLYAITNCVSIDTDGAGGADAWEG